MHQKIQTYLSTHSYIIRPSRLSSWWGESWENTPSKAVSIRMPAASHTNGLNQPIQVARKGGSCISNLENSTTLQFHGSCSPMRHVDDPALRNHALMQLQLLEEWRFIKTSLCRSNPPKELNRQNLQPTGSAMAHTKAYLQALRNSI